MMPPPPQPEPLKVAVVGDVHRRWSAADNAAFGASTYAVLLFVGDLPGKWHQGALETARAMAAVPIPAAWIPGNHDGPSPWAVFREALGLPWPGSAEPHAAGLASLQAALGPVRDLSYASATFGRLVVVGARPGAMDGRRLSFPAWLRARHGVDSLAASTARLIEVLEATPAGPLVVLAHNGPKGLGGAPGDPWASRRYRMDFGDEDLAEALRWARRHRSGPIAVAAGHMHRADAVSRRPVTERDGISFVHAARVPRVERRDGLRWAHHMALTEAGEAWRAEECWTSSSDDRVVERQGVQPASL